MQAHGFFGHVSPTTGTAADRTRKAGVDAMLILENVARAFTPGEAERGLMNSPGHRANILNHAATHVGVGVVYDPGSHEILVTQLFSQAARAVRRAHRRRSVAAASPRCGARTSCSRSSTTRSSIELATERPRASKRTHGMSATQAGQAHRSRACRTRAARWSAVRSLFAVVSPARRRWWSSLESALGDPSVTHVGLGVEPGKRKDGGSGLYVVIVLATRR